MSPSKLGAETLEPSAQPVGTSRQGPPVNTDAAGEYGTWPPVDTASATKDDEPPKLDENTWERCTDDTGARFDDRNLPPTRASTYDNRPPNDYCNRYPSPSTRGSSFP